MEEAKGAFLVRVPQEEEEAVDGVDGAVVPEERDPGAGQGSRVEVEVAGVEAVALGEHHPAARVEARVGDAAAARGGGAGAPAGADGSEADVVEQVARRQHARDPRSSVARRRLCAPLLAPGGDGILSDRSLAIGTDREKFSLYFAT